MSSITDFTAFLNASPEQLYADWLSYITTRDPLLQDTSLATFNSILAEAVASQFWIFKELLIQKVQDSNILTATGDALSAIVRAYSITRQPGIRATGVIKFVRNSPAPSAITIDAGILCGMRPESGGTMLQFRTTQQAIIAQGAYSAYAPAQAADAGIAYNVGANTITAMLQPVVGVSSVINDAPFSGGTGGESDEDLRARALYTFWVPGKATIPLMTEHIAGLEDAREVKITTLGQGDVLIVYDGESDEGLRDMIYENLASGCTCPGVLAASLLQSGNLFDLGDCAGADVWARTRDYIADETIVPFVYVNITGAPQNGTFTFPAGSGAGTPVKAELANTASQATSITSATYTGAANIDLYLGKGEYPYLWVPPTIRPAAVDATFVLTATPEVDLLGPGGKIATSIAAKLNSYKIGDVLEWEDVYLYCRVDYATGRLFSGIDRVPTFSITCRGQTLTGTGDRVVIDEDGRVASGIISAVAAT